MLRFFSITALWMLTAVQPAAALSPVSPISIGTCLAFEDAEVTMTRDTRQALTALVDAVQRTEGRLTALSIHVYFGRGVGAHIPQPDFVRALSLASRRLEGVVAALSGSATPVYERLFGATVLTSTSGGPLFAESDCSSSVMVQFAPGAVAGCNRGSCTITCMADKCVTK